MQHILLTYILPMILFLIILLLFFGVISFPKKQKKQSKVETIYSYLNEAKENIEAAIDIEMKNKEKDEQIYGHIAILNGMKRELTKIIITLPVPKNNIPEYKCPPTPLSEKGQNKIFQNQSGIIDKAGFL